MIFRDESLIGHGRRCPLSVCSLHEAIIPRGARQGQSQLKRTCSIFAYEDIKEVHKRRYLLQVSDRVQHCSLFPFQLKFGLD